MIHNPRIISTPIQFTRSKWQAFLGAWDVGVGAFESAPTDRWQVIWLRDLGMEIVYEFLRKSQNCSKKKIGYLWGCQNKWNRTKPLISCRAFKMTLELFGRNFCSTGCSPCSTFRRNFCSFICWRGESSVREYSAVKFSNWFYSSGLCVKVFIGKVVESLNKTFVKVDQVFGAFLNRFIS